MSRSSQQVYARLPVALQSAAVSVTGWRIQRSRYGRGFTSVLNEYRARSGWTEEQVGGYRDQRLAVFLKGAHRLPFYKERWPTADVREIEDLKQLPIITKQQVQEDRISLGGDRGGRETVTVHTSGTTGAGLSFPTTRSGEQEQWATWWRYRMWHGLSPGTWCGYFGGRTVVPPGQTEPPFWRYNLPGRQIMFSGYHMAPGYLDHYIKLLRRRRPEWLHGYPSLLGMLATHLLETGSSLDYQPQWVTTGSENLLEQQSRSMKQAFGVAPRQHYGMAEAVANISECPSGRLHVDEDFAAVEFLENGDGTYKIVGTNFSNPAFPLVRYDTGDVATLSDAGCDCGRPGRIVRSLDGRQEDYVILKDGAKLGRLDHLFKDMGRVREAQIYQPDLGVVILRVVRGEGYSEEDERLLFAEVERRFGVRADVKIVYYDHIPRTSSQKLRFVLSDVTHGRID